MSVSSLPGVPNLFIPHENKLHYHQIENYDIADERPQIAWKNITSHEPGSKQYQNMIQPLDSNTYTYVSFALQLLSLNWQILLNILSFTRIPLVKYAYFIFLLSSVLLEDAYIFAVRFLILLQAYKLDMQNDI